MSLSVYISVISCLQNTLAQSQVPVVLSAMLLKMFPSHVLCWTLLKLNLPIATFLGCTLREKKKKKIVKFTTNLVRITLIQVILPSNNKNKNCVMAILTLCIFLLIVYKKREDVEKTTTTTTQSAQQCFNCLSTQIDA